jgi:hypothetical protein
MTNAAAAINHPVRRRGSGGEATGLLERYSTPLISGQAEIGQLGAVQRLFDHDTARLDVPMNHALGVGRRQSRCNLRADSQNLQRRKPTGALDAFPQRAPGHEFHDDQRRTPELLHRIDRHDVRMIDRRCGASFAQEPPTGRVAGRQRAVQQLDGDGPAQQRVGTAQDHAHAAAPHNCQQLVLAQPPQRVFVLGRFEQAGVERLFLQNEFVRVLLLRWHGASRYSHGPGGGPHALVLFFPRRQLLQSLETPRALAKMLQHPAHVLGRQPLGCKVGQFTFRGASGSKRHTGRSDVPSR